MTTLNSLTPQKLNKMFATKTSKSWGFKSIKDAENNGYYPIRVSCEVTEICELLSITKNQARDIVQDWKAQDLIVYTSNANLDTMYFRK
jgi:hypothetical protein